MAIQQLNVKIGANVGGAVTGINQVNTQLGRLNQTTQKSTTNFTGLSRVIQDLPYGFNGIANNLQQILPAAGAAGLAISAITTAITFASIGFGAWTRGFQSANEKAKEHAKVVKEAKEALEEYVGSLEDINRIRVTGEQNASKELITLKALYDATQNVNIPLKKRHELVDELQKQYPSYFGNLSNETILTGGAAAAYGRLAKNILASATAKAAYEELEELSKDDRALTDQHTKALQKQSDAYQKLKKREEEVAKATKGVNAAEQSGLYQVAKAFLSSPQANEEARLRKEALGIAGQLETNLQRRLKIEREINSIIETNPDALLDQSRGLEKVNAAKVAPIKLGLRYDLAGDLNVDKTVTDLFKKINEATKAADAPSEFEKSFQEKLKKSLEKPIPARINIAPLMTPETESAAEKLGSDIGKIIAQSVAPGFSTFGESIGQAIAAGENPIAAAGASILTTIGDLISQIGKALIEYGVIKEGLDKILIGGIAIPGVAAIGLGVAAVAIGALIKSSFQKTKKFAEGGLVFGPTMGMVGEGVGTTRSNPEVIAPLDKLKKFIGGGNEPQIYMINGKVGWDGLALMAERMNKHKGRFQ